MNVNINHPIPLPEGGIFYAQGGSWHDTKRKTAEGDSIMYVGINGVYFAANEAVGIIAALTFSTADELCTRELTCREGILAASWIDWKVSPDAPTALEEGLLVRWLKRT